MSNTDDKKDEEIIVNNHDIEDKVNKFSEMLNDIENLDDKAKHLYKEIYENAIADRQNSYVMFSKLARIVSANNTTEFAIHAKSIRDFIERMQKANDQLSKLLELIIKLKQSNAEIDSETMFDEIKSFNQTKKK